MDESINDVYSRTNLQLSDFLDFFPNYTWLCMFVVVEVFFV